MLNTWTPCVAALAILGAATGCSSVTGVPAADLRPAVERDGVPFAAQSIPVEILDRLAANQVVVVGETHLISEHRQLVAELVRSLHSRGFRQLLLEWPHMADWLLSDFVEDGGLEPGWAPSVALWGEMITAVRDFNRSLPEADRVHVHAIDVNLDNYGGAPSFRNMLGELAGHLADRGPIGAFLGLRYGTPDEQTSALASLRSELQVRRTDLVAAWGSHWYDVVSEMVEVELASVGIRARRTSHYDQTAREREDVMKRLADLRLGGYGYRTLVNVGGNHAQKSRLKGTDLQWLGDYLVHESRAVGGAVFVVAVTPAQILSAAGGSAESYNVMEASPENELWRVMHETWPDRIGFLPLDDPLFGTGPVLMNFEGTIYEGAPKAHYDAFVLLPVGHAVATQ